MAATKRPPHLLRLFTVAAPVVVLADRHQHLRRGPVATDGRLDRADRVRFGVVRLPVRLLIEVVEQEIEEYAVRQREEDGPARVAAIGVDQLRRVQKGQAELDLE